MFDLASFMVCVLSVFFFFFKFRAWVSVLCTHTLACEWPSISDFFPELIAYRRWQKMNYEYFQYIFQCRNLMQFDSNENFDFFSFALLWCNKTKHVSVVITVELLFFFIARMLQRKDVIKSDNLCANQYMCVVLVEIAFLASFV